MYKYHIIAKARARAGKETPCWEADAGAITPRVVGDAKGCVCMGRMVDVCLYYRGITCTYLFCTCQYSNISMNKAHMHFPDPSLLLSAMRGWPCPYGQAGAPVKLSGPTPLRAAGRNGGDVLGGIGDQMLRARLETQL